MANFLESLSPQEMQQFMELYGLSQKGNRLGEMRRETAESRNRPSARHTTWAGALAGGLGDILGEVSSGVRERNLNTEAGKLEGQAATTRQHLMEAYAKSQGAGLAGDAPQALPVTGPEQGPQAAPPGPWAGGYGGASQPSAAPGPWASEYGSSPGGAAWSAALDQPPPGASVTSNPANRAPTARPPPGLAAIQALRSSGQPVADMTSHMGDPSYRSALTRTPQGMGIASLYDALQGYWTAEQNAPAGQQVGFRQKRGDIVRQLNEALGRK